MVGGWAHPTGAAYDQQGQLIEESRFRSSQILESKLDPIGSFSSLSGDWIFGGYFNEIYGHFILESLARLWVFEFEALSDFDLLFFPIRNYTSTANSYTRWFFDQFGLNAKRIEVVSEPTTVERLVVPSRSYDIRQGPQSKFLRQVAPVGRSSLPHRGRKKLYLSRRKLKTGTHKLINEERVEKSFEKLGFVVVHPQNMAPEQQVSLYRSATHIAGAAGSALHNSIFAPRDCNVLAINGRFDEAARREAALAGENFDSPMSPQDYLCGFAGQSLTYLHANRAFSVGSFQPRHMPYYIDGAFLQRRLAACLQSSSPISDPQPFCWQDAINLLDELIAKLFAARCYRQASFLVPLLGEISPDVSLSQDLERRVAVVSKRVGVSQPVKLFPDLAKGDWFDFLAACDSDAQEVIKELSKRLDQSSR